MESILLASYERWLACHIQRCQTVPSNPPFAAHTAMYARFQIPAQITTAIHLLTIKIEISPIWGQTVDSSQLTFVPTSKSCDTKTRLNIKNPARSNLDIVP